jgi:hypothetical protein
MEGTQICHYTVKAIKYIKGIPVMSLNINALDAGKTEHSITIDSEPDFCPLCNRHQVPAFVAAFKSEQNGCQIIFQCSNKKCLNFYIAYYDQPHPDHEIHYLRTIAPRNYRGLSFDNEIKELSSDFCEIYQEASFTEMQGYKQVAQGKFILHRK